MQRSRLTSDLVFPEATLGSGVNPEGQSGIFDPSKWKQNGSRPAGEGDTSHRRASRLQRHISIRFHAAAGPEPRGERKPHLFEAEVL
jgi:hypothetical protein